MGNLKARVLVMMMFAQPRENVDAQKKLELQVMGMELLKEHAKMPMQNAVPMENVEHRVNVFNEKSLVVCIKQQFSWFINDSLFNLPLK